MITRYRLYRDDYTDCRCEMDTHPTGGYADYEEVARLLAEKGMYEGLLKRVLEEGDYVSEELYADIEKAVGAS